MKKRLLKVRALQLGSGLAAAVVGHYVHRMGFPHLYVVIAMFLGVATVVTLSEMAYQHLEHLDDSE